MIDVTGSGAPVAADRTRSRAAVAQTRGSATEPLTSSAAAITDDPRTRGWRTLSEMLGTTAVSRGTGPVGRTGHPREAGTPGEGDHREGEQPRPVTGSQEGPGEAVDDRTQDGREGQPDGDRAHLAPPGTSVREADATAARGPGGSGMTPISPLIRSAREPVGRPGHGDG
jgi:hypothetical protein